MTASTLVLLHGFAGARAAWDEVVRRLPARLRAVPLAMVGHEAPTEAADSFVGEVDRLAREIERLGGVPCLLAGYSLGGRLALGLAVRHQELFGRVVLVGASPGLRGEDARRGRRASDQRWVRLLETEGLDAFLEAWQAQPLFASQASLPGEKRVLQERYRRSLDAAALAQAMRVLGLAEMPSYWSELERLELPVDLVVGALDAKFHALADEMAELLPQCELHVVPEVGHNVVLEAPAAMAEILAAATRRIGAGSTSRGRREGMEA